MQVWDWSGELGAADVHAITQDLESLLSDVGASKQSIKRTFTVLIEGLQNTLIHSTKSGDSPYYGLGVAFGNDEVNMLILSLADEKHVIKVKGLVADLNSMQPDALKEHYRMTMNNGKISEKGGAGLGLITMVMRSKDGLHVTSTAIDTFVHVLASRLSVV